MYDKIFKVIIFGDINCGKTSLRKRFMDDIYDSHCRKTIGVDFQTKDFDYNGMEVKLMIWDFAGEERFRYMFPQCLKGAMGGILMYDITNSSSFSSINNWLSLLEEMNQKFPIILVGGKSDLENIREVSREEALKVGRAMGLHGFIECSSKTGENVKESFQALTKKMLNYLPIKKRTTESIAI
ncbi:MAG: GTP-binding protein [Candidatus Thorarchaeota archaeon]